MMQGTAPFIALGKVPFMALSKVLFRARGNVQFMASKVLFGARGNDCSWLLAKCGIFFTYYVKHTLAITVLA